MLTLSIILLTCTLLCILITLRDIRHRKEYASDLLLAVSCLILGVVCFLNYKGVFGDSIIMDMGDAFEITNW
jgi:hypothetical protein